MQKVYSDVERIQKVHDAADLKRVKAEAAKQVIEGVLYFKNIFNCLLSRLDFYSLNVSGVRLLDVLNAASDEYSS
eukprot:gene14809-10589_t